MPRAKHFRKIDIWFTFSIALPLNALRGPYPLCNHPFNHHTNTYRVEKCVMSNAMLICNARLSTSMTQRTNQIPRQHRVNSKTGQLNLLDAKDAERTGALA